MIPTVNEQQAHQPQPDPGSPLETIKRLCALLNAVHVAKFGYDSGPCDCVCPDHYQPLGKSDPKCWRSTGDALRYIEHVVRAALGKEQPTTTLYRLLMAAKGAQSRLDVYRACDGPDAAHAQELDAAIDEAKRLVERSL